MKRNLISKMLGKVSSVMINRKIASFIDVDVEIWLFLSFSLSRLRLLHSFFLSSLFLCLLLCMLLYWMSLIFAFCYTVDETFLGVLCGINFFRSVSIISFFLSSHRRSNDETAGILHRKILLFKLQKLRVVSRWNGSHAEHLRFACKRQQNIPWFIHAAPYVGF
jgi:hypothetical protein